MESVSALDEHGAKTGHFITRLQMGFIALIFGETKKTLDEERVEDMAAIVKTYKGMTDLDEDAQAKSWIDLVMAFLIIANAVVICVEVDTTDITKPPAWYWLATEGFFALVFLVEVLLKMYYNGWRWMFEHPWNFITVLIMVCVLVDAAVFGPLEITVCFKAASLLRVLGLVRLRHSFRQLKSLNDLRVVFDGVAVGTRAILWVVLLVTGFVFICALFLTRQIGHNVAVYGDYRKLSGGWDHDEYFGTMARSMYTLLQVMTLDGWSSSIVRHCINQQYYMVYFFSAFLLITHYGVVNIVVSVIVQHICAAAERNAARSQEKAARDKKAEIEGIIEIFMKVDQDDSGCIEYEEFLEAIQNPQVLWRLRALEMPIDNAAKLFTVLSGVGSRPLTRDEFVKGCTKLKGPAQSKDLLGIQAQADSLTKKMDILCENLEEGERMLDTLDEVTNRMMMRFDPSIQGCRRKMARAVGGSKPMVQPPRESPAGDAHAASLAIGNRPSLPLFPDVLY